MPPRCLVTSTVASRTDSVIVLDVLPSLATEHKQNSNQMSPATTSTKQSAGKKWHQKWYQKCFKVDVIVVTATIAIVIGLFQLPIIYFYIPVVSEW